MSTATTKDETRIHYQDWGLDCQGMTRIVDRKA